MEVMINKTMPAKHNDQIMPGGSQSDKSNNAKTDTKRKISQVCWLQYHFLRIIRLRETCLRADCNRGMMNPITITIIRLFAHNNYEFRVYGVSDAHRHRVL